MENEEILLSLREKKSTMLIFKNHRVPVVQKAAGTHPFYLVSNWYQMAKTERMLHINLDFLPLKSYNNIKEGNALRMDWNEVVPASELNYIMGNPPKSFIPYMSS